MIRRNKSESIFKYIYPSILIFLFVFIYEGMVFNSDGNFITDYKIYLRLFSGYLILSIFIGFINLGLFAPVATNPNSYDLRKKPYINYFIKSVTFTLFIILVLVSRELTNQPAFYVNTLLSDNFAFSQVFNFIQRNFSPLYFTLILGFIIASFIYRSSKKFKLTDSKIKLFFSLVSLGIFFVLVINYGFLNASNTRNKNLVFMAVSGLDNSDIKKYDSFESLKKNSYNFINFYSSSINKDETVTSIFDSNFPSNLLRRPEIDGGNIKYVTDNFIKKLLDKKYSVLTLSDGSFQLVDNLFENTEKIIPSNKNSSSVNIISSHPLSTVFINNPYSFKYFPEILELDSYNPRDYVHKKIELLANKDNPFAIFYILTPDKKRLVYPYYNKDKSIKENYFNYLNEELIILSSILDKTGKKDETIFVLTGLNDNVSDIKLKDLETPLIISGKDMTSERTVKNNYSHPDIYPTVYEMLLSETLKDRGDGKSLLDTAFVRQCIFVEEDESLTRKRLSIFGYKNPDKDFVDLMKKRTMIYGSFKLNYIPKKNNVEFQLYDIADSYENREIGEEKPRSKDYLISKFYKRAEEFGYKIIEGYLVNPYHQK